MPKVLLLTGDEREACGLQGILGDYADVVHARGISEMKSHLEDGNWDVLFCAGEFHHAFRNGALQELRERYPHLAVVVLSSNRGGRD